MTYRRVAELHGENLTALDVRRWTLGLPNEVRVYTIFAQRRGRRVQVGLRARWTEDVGE